jgi:hypothetical protein
METTSRIFWSSTRPIAVKMLASEDEIPEDALRPKRDRGEHYAACQVF